MFFVVLAEKRQIRKLYVSLTSPKYSKRKFNRRAIVVHSEKFVKVGRSKAQT
jgi:hypothetical protein